MQWSADHNAGFSTAPSSDLYSPVIDGQESGYRVVNVEAQDAEPGSLLNWMRRMIRLRRQHPALSRGDMQMVESSNPAILAFLRSFAEETILVVGNLAGESETVELDLGNFAGSQPTDLLQQVAHPSLSDGPCRMDLARYEYRWLRL